jgi:hypothetical protein
VAVRQLTGASRGVRFGAGYQDRRAVQYARPVKNSRENERRPYNESEKGPIKQSEKTNWEFPKLSYTCNCSIC